MKHKRRQYWMGSNIQRSFTKAVVAGGAFTAMLGSVIGFYLGASGAIRATGYDDPGIVLAWLARPNATALMLGAMVSAVAVGLLACLGIGHSHRIAGPMVPIHRALSRIREGDFSDPIVIRKGDLLQDLVGDLNLTFSTIQQRHDSLQTRIRELTHQTGGTGSPVDPASESERQEQPSEQLQTS